MRQKAEKTLKEIALTPAKLEKMSPEEIEQTIHELQIHQIELDMQNKELQRTQAELAASKARYFELYDLAPIGYCTITDQEGLFLEVNTTACILLGINREMLLGQKITQFIHKEDQDIYYLRRKELIKTGERRSFEIRMVKVDATVFYMNITILAAQEPDGTSVHRIVLADITQRKLTETTLRCRLQIEELTARISNRFVGISEEEIAPQIESSLQEVAGFANAKGIRVVLFCDNGTQYFKVYDWSSDKSQDIKEELEGLSVKSTPWLFNLLKSGEVVVVPSIHDLPEEAHAEKIIWKRWSVGSFVAIPLVRGKSTLGYLAFDRKKTETIWSQDDIRLLRLVGEIFINALQLQEVKKKKKLLRAQLKKQYSLNNIIGKHGKMEELFRLVHKVSPENTTVMIYGETGVGKEMIARAIHQLSPRSTSPIYAINCAAIPENLLESELFGYERGAFTGAYARKKGILEEASSSTLFLDEIGDLSLPLQSKILRLLQEREIQRLGGTAPISIDVRIVSATHQNLGQKVNKGEFRADLYYRLNTFPIVVPALRERTTDIPLLVNHFLQKYKKGSQTQTKKISFHALESLLIYPWPGNIRELESVIERAMILAEGELIQQEDLPEEIRRIARTNNTTDGLIDLPENGLNLEELEKYLLTRALEKSGGVIAKAARLLSITYRTFQYRMNKFGLTDYTKG